MNKEFKPTAKEPVIDPTNIKQQFNQINKQAEEAQQAQPQQMTPEEMDKQRKLQEKMLDETLPYLRKQEEATRLEMQLVRYDVLMGRTPATQIPGTFGKQLEVECMEAQLQWSGMKLDQQAMMKRAMEEKAELEEQMKKQGLNIQEQPVAAATPEAIPVPEKDNKSK